MEGRMVDLFVDLFCFFFLVWLVVSKLILNFYWKGKNWVCEFKLILFKVDVCVEYWIWLSKIGS